jgi:hypothetical protein
MVKKNKFILSILIPSLVSSGTYLAKWLLFVKSNGNISIVQWYEQGYQYPPWHDEILLWIMLHLFGFLLGAVFFFLLRRVILGKKYYRNLIALIPITLFFTILIYSINIYGWMIFD